MNSLSDSSSEENREKLTSAIKSYRENRERLIKIQASTQEAFNQMKLILQKNTSELLGCVNMDNLAQIPDQLGAPTHKTEVDPVNLAMSIVAMSIHKTSYGIENPAIPIIGQVKAGKSTFINVLLRKNVVTQSFEKCTARLTRLQYSSTNYIQIVDKNGEVLEKKKLKNTTIPKKYVQLDYDNRENLEETNKQIIAGINSKFLQCGIDIIDTPGLSENETLDKMSKNVVKNVLPVMIYVIDGRHSVTQTDITYLNELKNSQRSIHIIYFITKLDPEDESEKDPLQMAKDKMEEAFRKLQNNLLIPKEKYANWTECPYFHGASLYHYMDYFRNKINDEIKFHYELFAKFERCLCGYLMERFEIKIDESCETLINFHMDVLTKIIRRAQDFADYTKDNLKQIINMRKIEEELFEKIKTVISESREQLKDQLIMRLKNESEALIDPIANIEYPAELKVPQDGHVKSAEQVQACMNKIVLVICQGLENLIKQFVEEELFNKYRNTIDSQVTNRMKVEMQEQNEKSEEQGKSPYRIVLERILASKYKFNALSGLNETEGKNAITKFMENIFASITWFLKKLFRVGAVNESVDVKSPEWKLKQARDCLDKLDHKMLADDVCKNLQEDFNEKHNNFLLALEFEHNFVQQNIRISEDTRKQVADKAPDFAGLLMLTLDVKSRYKLQNVRQIDKIGQGAQGEVFHCKIGDEDLAKKTTTLPMDQLNGIAEEVYYSYLFNHPHMLQLKAVQIEDTTDVETKKISVYSTLMKTDVSKFLKKGQHTFEIRMNIGLQVGEALHYMHSQSIMHRDLKLANILLDENNNVYLADYGFCKSMALSDHSFVGTPVHIAPEIVRKEIYDYKVDIFSFGILLWYLAEGSGRHPRFARVQSNIAQVLWAACEHNMRPERLDYIPSDLWDLMEQCWDNDKTVRPDIDEVLIRLRKSLTKYSTASN